MVTVFIINVIIKVQELRPADQYSK